MFGSLDRLQLLQNGEIATERTLREVALEVGSSSLEMNRNENDVNRSKATNNKVREVITEMKEYDQREGVGD